jgi:hypothetical protein
VFRRLCITLGLILTCQFAAAADARWCTITEKRDTDALVYPPIARVAHVDGIVIQRINFTSAGKVLSVESISGPQMLATSTARQLKTWHLQTDATGDQDCQSLILVRYRIYLDDPPPTEEHQSTPGMFQISIDGLSLVISDPAATITKRRRFHLF